MVDILMIIGVIVVVVGLHYVLWKKIQKDWFGGLKGFRKSMLILASITVEIIITVFWAVSSLNSW